MHIKTIATIVALTLATAGFCGEITRNRAEVRAFRNENPCPSTGLNRGACPGYQVDHGIPLCAGGADTKANMHWLSIEDHKFKTRIDIRECRRAKRAPGG